MQTIRGTFQSRRTLSKAVRRLSENSVPADMIDVQVVDAHGNLRREIAVEDEAGTLRGAIFGALGGAVLGVIVVGLVLAGALGPSITEPFGLRTLTGAIRAILTLTVAGMPFGAIIGLGYWRVRTKLGPTEMRDGSFAIVVETEELAETARDVLESAGAMEVKVGEDSL